MVTHDRYLINQTANYISELSPKTHNLTHFRGNYRNYLSEKERQYQRLKQMREQQDKEIIGDLHVVAIQLEAHEQSSKCKAQDPFAPQ